MSAGPEHRLQIAIKKWVREAVPFPHVFLAFDRSAARSPLQHLHEKTRGARAGTPDVVLLWRGAKPLARPALSLTSRFAKQEFDESGHGIGR